MFSFTVNGKEYKVKYGYRVLSQTDILTQVGNLNKISSPKDIITLLPELILAGLQSKHKDEFGYETAAEKKVAYEKVCDLLDDYEDESTEENPHDGFSLFQEANKELERNGFLSGMVKMMEEEIANEKKKAKKN